MSTHWLHKRNPSRPLNGIFLPWIFSNECSALIKPYRNFFLYKFPEISQSFSKIYLEVFFSFLDVSLNLPKIFKFFLRSFSKFPKNLLEMRYPFLLIFPSCFSPLSYSFPRGFPLCHTSYPLQAVLSTKVFNFRLPYLCRLTQPNAKLAVGVDQSCWVSLVSLSLVLRQYPGIPLAVQSSRSLPLRCGEQSARCTLIYCCSFMKLHKC